jgi:hypothetical protein
MENRELARVFELIIGDAAAIAHNQRVLADVHVHLDQRYENPFEQDLIYADHFGARPSEPREFTFKGVRITSHVLHQTGRQLSDIRGADLLYEIEDEKFILILYKKVHNTRVPNNPRQLRSFLNNCPEKCWHRKCRPLPAHYLPLMLNPFCGCWYCLITGVKHTYFHACEVEAIFNGRQSASADEFGTGLSRRSFMELFASCRIGALLYLSGDEDLVELYTEYLLEIGHIIYQVRQHGHW